MLALSWCCLTCLRELSVKNHAEKYPQSQLSWLKSNLQKLLYRSTPHVIIFLTYWDILRATLLIFIFLVLSLYPSPSSPHASSSFSSSVPTTHGSHILIQQPLNSMASPGHCVGSPWTLLGSTLGFLWSWSVFHLSCGTLQSGHRAPKIATRKSDFFCSVAKQKKSFCLRSI